MAYGNWGAFVYKNGERQKNREDNTPFSEDELQAGYHQAFGGTDANGLRAMTGKKLHVVHASLGNGLFRLCGYKSYPMIYWDGEELDIKKYLKDGDSWYDSGKLEGEHNGYKFKAWSSEWPETVHLHLIEPDGTQWTGRSGYGIGAGHED